jgi:hypothetical protein
MASESTDVSEDEAYDPWPGCVMDRTGCHGQSYYNMKYIVNEQLVSFFNLENNAKITYNNFDNIVIDYAFNNNGISDDKGIIFYDEALWKLFELDKDTPLKFYHINKYFVKFI